MIPLAEVRKLNCELADRINQETRANPQSPYAGKFVCIANGQVVGIAATLRDAARLLERVEPDNARVFLLDVAADYSKTEYIWELR
jgi:hypothetical protein